MTKRDFELIARVLRVLSTEGTRCFDNFGDCRAIAQTFADELSRTNEHFDNVRFIRACLPEVK